MPGEYFIHCSMPLGQQNKLDGTQTCGELERVNQVFDEEDLLELEDDGVELLDEAIDGRLDFVDGQGDVIVEVSLQGEDQVNEIPFSSSFNK